MSSESKALYTTKSELVNMLKSINEKVNGSESTEVKASKFGHVTLHPDHQFITMRSQMFKKGQEEVYSEGTTRHQIYIDHIDDDGSITLKTYMCSGIADTKNLKGISTSDNSTYYLHKPTLEVETREYHDQLVKESGWSHNTEYMPTVLSLEEPKIYVTEPDLRMIFNSIKNKSLPDTGDYKTLHIADDCKILLSYASIVYTEGVQHTKYAALMHHEIVIDNISDDGVITLGFKPIEELHPYLGNVSYGVYAEDNTIKVTKYEKYLTHQVIHMAIETQQDHQSYIDKYNSSK